MRRFTELLLLVTCILTPLFFVNGFQALQPTTKNNPLRRDAMIRGLLAPRGFFCPSGFICETDFCCHENWHCCKSKSLFPSFESNCHRRAKKFCRRWLLRSFVSFFLAPSFNGLKYTVWIQELLFPREQWGHWMLSQRKNLFGTSRRTPNGQSAAAATPTNEYTA